MSKKIISNDQDGNFETDKNKEEYVSFYVGGQFMGISVDKVQEIIPIQEITPTPRSHKSIMGMLNLRGQIVTSLDLKSRLNIGEQSSDNYMNVIVQDDNELFSIVVDSVGDVLTFSSDQSLDPPATLPEGLRKYCSLVYEIDKKLLLILNIEKVLTI